MHEVKEMYYCGNPAKPKKVLIIGVIDTCNYCTDIFTAIDEEGNIIKDYASLFSDEKPIAYNPYEY